VGSQAEVRAAISRSRSVTPPSECVDHRTSTRLYRMSMSGWWFSRSASSATHETNAIAAGKLSSSNSRTSASSSSRHPSGTLMRLTMPDRKPRAGFELLCELVFRPVAHVVARALLPLRVPPPAVVLAGTATGLAAAVEIGRHGFLAAALLLQLKTVLDNADGQLARLSGRITAFGRYLDSESDLLVDAAVFAALGLWIGPWLALAGFAALTSVLSINFNLERLYRGAAAGASDGSLVARIYGIVYAPQDRLAEALVRRRPARTTVGVVANFGLSTQLAALGVCLALGHPRAYLVVLLFCTTVVIAFVANQSRRRTT
jgi:archaetidylinositol phosphate synthase